MLFSRIFSVLFLFIKFTQINELNYLIVAIKQMVK